ncbi:MAG: hypothetical protein IKH76_08635, partial [Clostridiales bacterium]|nr:hypothetical protein [Clostridiales bacterium]
SLIDSLSMFLSMFLIYMDKISDNILNNTMYQNPATGPDKIQPSLPPSLDFAPQLNYHQPHG